MRNSLKNKQRLIHLNFLLRKRVSNRTVNGMIASLVIYHYIWTNIKIVQSCKCHMMRIIRYIKTYNILDRSRWNWSRGWDWEDQWRSHWGGQREQQSSCLLACSQRSLVYMPHEVCNMLPSNANLLVLLLQQKPINNQPNKRFW